MSQPQQAQWMQIPCLPWSPPGKAWSATCYMTEGYGAEDHTHFWDSVFGAESITVHRRGERLAPDETSRVEIRKH